MDRLEIDFAFGLAFGLSQLLLRLVGEVYASDA